MDATVVRRNMPSPGATSLTELWSFRELLRSLVIRNLKVKYQRSVLGFLWTLVNPLLTAGVLIVVFSIIVRIQLDDYWAFLISGYFVWAFVSQSLGAGTTVFDEHAALRRSIAFPNELLIFAGAIARLVEFSVELGIAIIALAAFHHGGLPASFLLLPVLMVLQLLLVGRPRLSVLAFLGWRLVKPGVRLIRRALGRDPLPSTVILRLWWFCLRGLVAYPAAQRLALQRASGRSG